MSSPLCYQCCMENWFPSWLILQTYLVPPKFTILKCNFQPKIVSLESAKRKMCQPKQISKPRLQGAFYYRWLKIVESSLTQTVIHQVHFFLADQCAFLFLLNCAFLFKHITFSFIAFFKSIFAIKNCDRGLILPYVRVTKIENGFNVTLFFFEFKPKSQPFLQFAIWKL